MAMSAALSRCAGYAFCRRVVSAFRALLMLGLPTRAFRHVVRARIAVGSAMVVMLTELVGGSDSASAAGRTMGKRCRPVLRPPATDDDDQGPREL